MNYWRMKSEPGASAYDDLLRDRRTDGRQIIIDLESAEKSENRGQHLELKADEPLS
ncbi:MAG: hypothetical protein AAF519_02165 [Bacteroidota bacterium]